MFEWMVGNSEARPEVLANDLSPDWDYFRVARNPPKKDDRKAPNHTRGASHRCFRRYAAKPSSANKFGNPRRATGIYLTAALQFN